MALSYNTRIHFPLTGCIVADVRISIARYIQRRGFAGVCVYKIKSKHAKTPPRQVLKKYPEFPHLAQATLQIIKTVVGARV